MSFNNYMKKLFIALLLLSAPLSLFAKDIFFECEIQNAKYGTFANITYNPETDVAGIESDFMNNGPEIFKVTTITKTGNELVLGFYAYYGEPNLSHLRIDRKSLKLSGIRKGVCKIVEKDLAF